MIRKVSPLTFLIAVCLIWGCASRAPVTSAPAEWAYEERAVRLHFTGDPQLNLYDGRPHALVVCVYQLRDPNAFNQLLGEREGMAKLLECSRFDSSVAACKRQVLQPGQEIRETLDRAEGAKYVGIVGGYYVVQKGRPFRLLPIPVVTEKKGLLGQTRTVKPGTLDIDLYMAPHEIKDVKGK